MIASAMSGSEETFSTSASSSFALASRTRARSSRSCCGMQHLTLGQRGVHHRPRNASPVFGVALAHDDDVEGHSKRAKRSAETHHLGVAVQRVPLYDEEIKVAVACSVPACARAEQNDLDWISGGCGQ